ncbi:hypothetical protein [[Mycoplasma] cavipharyngis]|uniref:hypothetical protein n=1 Tax=[Mycoplasma] cavipharyngis TaxID=92757 RepID=UPI003704A1D4
MLIGDKPFSRIADSNKEKAYQLFVAKIKPIYHENNFTKIYIRTIYDYVAINELEFLEIYLFSLLKKWVAVNEKYDLKYLKKYQKLIKFLEIENKFGFLEYYYWEHLNNIIFTKNRTLKSLNPNFSMHKKETNYFFYSDLIFHSDAPKLHITHLQCSLFVTNKRLIIVSPTMYLVFNLKELKNLKLNSNNVRFDFEKIYFILETNIPEVIYISLNRMMQLKR